jgi:2-oxo-4-hydroxy-4-carboxy-5-ureidoimidazoline decarboxylase
MPTIRLDELNRMTEAAFAAALGGIVEHAPWVAAAVAERRPYGSLGLLFSAFRDAILARTGEERLALLRAHPELAGLAARSGTMTAESVAEQQAAGLAAITAERARIFDALNAAYNARFGFPFIICVRRHGGDSILSEFRRRLDETAEAEAETALAEVLRIVALRLDALIDAPDRLPVTGRLSTHVLDTTNGTPARGVAVALFEIQGEGARPLGSATTNEGGRTDAPLIADRPLPIATYELRFHLGDYFRGWGAALAEPAFLDIVPIRFAIAEPEGHYHVPLVATPWSYSTYRGS